jgi:hypothetical protein
MRTGSCAGCGPWCRRRRRAEELIGNATLGPAMIFSRMRSRGVRSLASILVLMACKSNDAGTRTPDGATQTPDGADATAIGDAFESGEAPPVGEELGHCTPGAPASCPAGSECVEGCPNRLPSPGGVCSVSGRESCACGIFLSPCTTPGLVCLTCCDSSGLCVTPAEKAVVCAGPDRLRFDCNN